MSTRLLTVAVLAACLGAFPAVAAPKYSDAVTSARPTEGEYFGLYLMGRKVGFLYTHLKFVPGRDDQVSAVSEFVFKAQVGTKTSERRMKETRTYEAKPGGRLLSFVVEQMGDGGDQTLEATTTAQGMKVLRKRPGQPNEVLTRKASREVVEDADQARVALKRAANVVGYVTDGMDLESYKVTTTIGESGVRTIAGVPVRVRKVTTISEKEKVPADAWFDEHGRMLEMRFGDNMRAYAESADIAKRIDKVEVFGLTRVVMPSPAPESAHSVPGQMTLVLGGLPEKFRKSTYRQKVKTLPSDRVEVTLLAATPAAKGKVRPLADPNGGENLKSTLVVEASNPEIVALAKSIVKDDKDAYSSAKKIIDWVATHLVKDYGSSSDRATDVLRTKKGDCTEHSLLAVALLRAVGIPSKRVDGVVYLMNDDKVPALYWHEWVEAYVGEWTQMDPTFHQHVADATHLALGEEGGAEITPLIGQLQVLEVR